MSPNFKFYYILCTTPPDLENERVAFESAVAEFVEQVSMPEGVLLAAASLRPPVVASRQKPAIDSNIRTCEFFLQIFGEQWPDPVFPGFVEYAIECLANPSMVTRNVCVLFRNYQDAARELRQFREALAAGGRCALGDFTGTGDLAVQLRALLAGWYASLKPAAG
jgi:hypothetical protein